MWAPRLPSVAPVSFFSRENSSPTAAGSAFSAAMIRSRSGWWMMSSSSAIALAPAHPEAADDQPAAIDHRHPQIDPTPEKEIAYQRQRRDAEPDRDKGETDPQSDDGVDHHEIGRPEHTKLARRKMPELDRQENPKGKEQQECRDHPEIEAVHARSPALEDTDRKRPG